MTSKITLYWCFICLILPNCLFAVNSYSIGTGGPTTASWQLTEEINRLWKIKNPEQETGFTQLTSKNIHHQFEQLEKGLSKMVIAPLTAETENYALDKFKVALVLWRVYVIPIDLGHHDKKVDFTNNRYLYSPKTALIIPTLMETYGIDYFETTVKKAYYNFSGPTGLGSAGGQDPFQNIQEKKPGIINRNITSEILQVNHIPLKEIGEEYNDGILFIETIGMPRWLKTAFNRDVSWVGFDTSLVNEITNQYSWISSFKIPRGYERTLSFKVGLFVSESEDPEFVEEMIDLLSNFPTSYFPRSHVLSSLVLRLTKEVSPFILHEAALSHFNL